MISFWEGSEADDINEYLFEVFTDHGWEVDWYDLLSYEVDTNELTHYIFAISSLSSDYTFDDAEVFVNQAVSVWAGSARRFCNDELAGY